MMMLKMILQNRGRRSLKLIKIPQSHWYNLSKTWNMILMLVLLNDLLLPVYLLPLLVRLLKLVSAAENLMYIRRSAEKRKDKGKAIMKEDESVQKKIKKQLEQKRLGHEEAIRLQEQINEEERQRIARDAEIAKQLQEEFNRARQEQEVVAEANQAHDIDWSDPAVLRYHAVHNRSFFKAEVRKNMCIYLKNQRGYKLSHFKGMSYEDIRPIFERV
ncbi:hypothetical protein Tco_0101969 [Tanacetum coccineum]